MKVKYNDSNAPLDKCDFDLIKGLIPNLHLCLRKHYDRKTYGHNLA